MFHQVFLHEFVPFFIFTMFLFLGMGLQKFSDEGICHSFRQISLYS
jgi:hypothetical protein